MVVVMVRIGRVKITARTHRILAGKLETGSTARDLSAGDRAGRASGSPPEQPEREHGDGDATGGGWGCQAEFRGHPRARGAGPDGRRPRTWPGTSGPGGENSGKGLVHFGLTGHGWNVSTNVFPLTTLVRRGYLRSVPDRFKDLNPSKASIGSNSRV